MTPRLSSPQCCHAERGLSFATAKLNRSRSTPTTVREMSCSAADFNIEGFERARLQRGRCAPESGTLAPEGASVQ